MKFINIEGLDGSGKSTQVKLLREYFENNNLKYEYIHFPILTSPVFGDMIARFLRGELGDNDSVDPYLVAMLYAGDRNNMATKIREWLYEGTYVLIDRYVMSNIAYQCAKVNDHDKREELRKWILDLEYNYYGIPKPDINIYLDVPFEFTEQQLTNTREGDDRDYLNGKTDIHEDDLSFQQRVKELYNYHADKSDDIVRLKCSDNNGKMLDKDAIFSKLIDTIKELL
ncbi:MAG: dTMP kinase [Bacteroidales bacterium]|jgi:dTMP kinase|nr:dTMP kinase [Bacteroidales bacterium]